MGEFLNQRRQKTDERFAKLRASLADAETILAGRACVYTTGSVARGEAGIHSDLDIFIVGLEDKKEQRLFSRLDEIVVKAQLIEMSRRAEFPDFSGDGEYLDHYSSEDLCRKLGKPDDDAKNTFTARLLLLLESRPLLGDDVYKTAIESVITSYWRDYEKNSGSFVPAFLANDILRLWKTFCVNYEARTQKEPEEERAKRKLLNYKLKHSRMLTCYSALMYLAWVFSNKKTVSPPDAMEMVGMTPTRRLEWLKEQRDFSQVALVDETISAYERFLQATDAPKKELIGRFTNKETATQHTTEAREFGDKIFRLLNAIGGDSVFYRFLVV